MKNDIMILFERKQESPRMIEEDADCFDDEYYLKLIRRESQIWKNKTSDKEVQYEK